MRSGVRQKIAYPFSSGAPIFRMNTEVLSSIAMRLMTSDKGELASWHDQGPTMGDSGSNSTKPPVLHSRNLSTPAATKFLRIRRQETRGVQKNG